MNFYVNILSYILFIPFVGMILLAFIHKEHVRFIRLFTIFVTVVDFIMAVMLFIGFNPLRTGLQFVVKKAWVSSYGISYFVGVDGISLLLIVLTTFLSPLIILSTWNSIKEHVKEFMILYLLLQTGMLGVFMSLDLILFYVFWEAMLIPMYFIIGVWGGPRRIYASVKFFLYTMFGGALMLVGILVLYFMQYNVTGEYTFDLYRIIKVINIPFGTQVLLFLTFGIAFAIKVPLFPFHTWLPDAHVEAPTAGSVILAGVLLKMGTYGFLRFCIPLFADVSTLAFPIIASIAVIGIIYGAMMALAQQDLKKLVAYSSISHLGFVVLGIFSLTEEGLTGGIIQMVNHGISTGALFLMVGMLYERRHTRMIDDFGGLAKQMPVISTFFMIVMLSSLALPGTNGFVGEFLILIGTFMRSHLFGVLGTVGVVLTAVYLLWMYQRVVFGKITHSENKDLKDLNAREIAILVPLIVMILWIGITPLVFTGKTSKSVISLLELVQTKKRIVHNTDTQNKIKVDDSKYLVLGKKQ